MSMVPFAQSMLALVVAKKGLPKMIGVWVNCWASSMSKIRKSTKKKQVSIQTRTSSTSPLGVLTDRYAKWRIIGVGLSSPI